MLDLIVTSLILVHALLVACYHFFLLAWAWALPLFAAGLGEWECRTEPVVASEPTRVGRHGGPKRVIML